jgi:hypothetical protein
MKKILCIILMASGLQAQEEIQLDNLREAVGNLAETVAKKYVAPVVSGFGASMNSGWFHSAPRPEKLGFHLEVGVVGMGSLFHKKHKTFSADGSLQLNRGQAEVLTSIIFDRAEFAGLSSDELAVIQESMIQQILAQSARVHVSGATAVGSRGDSIRIVYQGATLSYTDPRDGEEYAFDLAGAGSQVALPVYGLELPLVGWAAYQISIGTIYGTHFTFRFLPTSKSQDEIGSFRYSGFGIQHNPMVWSKKPRKYNLAISLFTQRLEQGEFFESRASAIGLTASRRFGWRWLNVHPYAGLMYERSRMRFRYDLEKEDGSIEPIRFDVAGENSWRLTLGTSVRVLIGNLNVDYSLSKYSSLSAGLTVII